MLYWSPTSSDTATYSPQTAWNTAFSEKDKIQFTNLFFFFKNKKGFKETTAKTLAEMAVFKQKYNGLKYSEEQEEILQRALKPIFNS